MYFLPRNNKIYSALVTVKPAHRYYVSLAILMLITALWIVCFYYPVEALIERKRNEIKQIHDRNSLCMQAKTGCVVLQESVAAMQSKIATYAKVASRDVCQEAMFYVMQKAHQMRVALNSCALDEQHNQGWYTEQKAHLALSGDFPHIMQFLDSLTASDFLMAFDDFSLSRSAENSWSLKGTLKIIALK